MSLPACGGTGVTHMLQRGDLRQILFLPKSFGEQLTRGPEDHNPSHPALCTWSGGPCSLTPVTQVCLSNTYVWVFFFVFAKHVQWRVYTIRVLVKWVLVSRGDTLGPAAHCLGAGLAKGKGSRLVAAASLARGINSCSGDPGKNCCTGKVNCWQKLWGHCSSKDNLQGMKHGAIFFPFRVKEKDLKYRCSVFVLSFRLALPFNCFSPFHVNENQDGLTFCFSAVSSQRRS